MHSSTAADDALQEAFTRGLDRISTWRDGDPRSWLWSITLNVCRRAIIVGAVEPSSVDPQVLQAAQAARGVLTSVVRREASRRLAVALGYLNPRQREAFVLHAVEGFPYDQIGEMLGVTAEAARQMAHRARVTLRERLGPENPLSRM